MKQYKINEIFYSIQGEGYNAGSAAVFIRFSGCNLACPFCDTQHKEGTLMTTEDICNEIRQYPTLLVVLTGGEPALYIDDELCSAIHAMGKMIAIETNGTVPITAPIDHITCSPKFEFCDTPSAKLHITTCDELKVVFTGSNDMTLYEDITAHSYYLQPCDTGNPEENQRITQAALQYVLDHPKWSLSLQLHKILNVR